MSIINAYAKNGIYITLESGIAKQNGLPNASQAGANQMNTEYFPGVARVAIGYNHDLYDYLGIGLDIGLGYYGTTHYDYSTYKSDVYSKTLEFLGVAAWHMKNWDLIGKVGGIRQKLMITGNNSSANPAEIAPEISIGCAYNFNAHVALIADYAHVFGDQIQSFNGLKDKTPSLNELLFGIRYIFGP